MVIHILIIIVAIATGSAGSLLTLFALGVFCTLMDNSPE